MTLPKPTESRIARLQKEGRGRGEGPEYRAWFLAMEISSLGLSHRAFSPKTQRVHEYVSDGELDFHCMLEWSPEVIDIREQFPIPREQTRQHAGALGIKHPFYPQTQVEMVMTVDFLVTRMRDGQEVYEAYDVKHSSGVEDPRTLEKLEIVRSVLSERGVPHCLVCHTEVPTQKIEHLKWIFSGQMKPGEAEPAPGFFDDYAGRMLADLRRASGHMSLGQYCASFDERFALQGGTGLRLAKLLMYRRDMVPDLDQPSLQAAPLRSFSLAAAVPGPAQMRA